MSKIIELEIQELEKKQLARKRYNSCIKKLRRIANNKSKHEGKKSKRQ